MSTIQRPKRQVGWGLLDIEAKCQALLLGRIWMQSTREGSATATWLQEWNLAGPRGTPPYVRRIPTKLMYLHRYALDMAYITPLGNNETLRTFKRRVYSTLHIMAGAAKEAPEMRITRVSPETNWKQVWEKKLHTAWVPEETTSSSYVVVHDIIPTNGRLHAIRLVKSDRCTGCERRYILTHPLTECNEGAIWQ